MYEALTSSIIESIADHNDVDPDELDFVLADYIDPDAVEQLARHSNSTWRLQFELQEHSVTVKSDGGVLVAVPITLLISPLLFGWYLFS